MSLPHLYGAMLLLGVYFLVLGVSGAIAYALFTRPTRSKYRPPK